MAAAWSCRWSQFSHALRTPAGRPAASRAHTDLGQNLLRTECRVLSLGSSFSRSAALVAAKIGPECRREASSRRIPPRATPNIERTRVSRLSWADHTPGSWFDTATWSWRRPAPRRPRLGGGLAGSTFGAKMMPASTILAPFFTTQEGDRRSCDRSARVPWTVPKIVTIRMSFLARPPACAPNFSGAGHRHASISASFGGRRCRSRPR